MRKNLFDARWRDEIITLLENGHNINTRNHPDFATPFIYHCYESNIIGLITLLEYGCNVLLRDRRGYSGLDIIVRGGRMRFLMKLLEYDVIRNMINIENQPFTPLVVACTYGHVDIFDILIEYGADPNLPTSDGNTPLIQACSSASIDIVNRLIALNVDVNAKNLSARSALFYCDSVPFLHQLMIGGIDLNSTDIVGQSALHYWIRHDDHDHDQKDKLELMEIYIDYGGNVNLQNNAYKTPLIYAVNTPGYIKLLLSKSADVNIQDNKGKTALMYALETNKLDSCEILIEAGSDLYIQDNEGKNAIQYAAQNSDTRDLLSRYLQGSK